MRPFCISILLCVLLTDIAAVRQENKTPDDTGYSLYSWLNYVSGETSRTFEEPDVLQPAIRDFERSVHLRRFTLTGISYYYTMSLEGVLSFMETTQCVERLLCNLGLKKEHFTHRSVQGTAYLFLTSVLPEVMADKVHSATRDVFTFSRKRYLDNDCSYFHCLSDDTPLWRQLSHIARTFLKHVMDSGCFRRLACEWMGVKSFKPKYLGNMAVAYISQILWGEVDDALSATLQQGLESDCEHIRCEVHDRNLLFTTVE